MLKSLKTDYKMLKKTTKNILFFKKGTFFFLEFSSQGNFINYSLFFNVYF